MVIVGLGNPGQEYAQTRHNAGFLVLEAAHRRWRAGSWHKSPLYDEAPLRLAGREHCLVRPNTFMNCSGEAIAALLKGGIPPHELLVILDDVDLPLGRLRIRNRGGAGGHKGLQSILDVLFPASVTRLRVGVGRPTDEEPLVDHVLGAFDRDEWARFDQVLDRVLEALLILLRDGIQKAMNHFNALPAPWEPPRVEPTGDPGRTAAQELDSERGPAGGSHRRLGRVQPRDDGPGPGERAGAG